ncbi:MAG TPA: alpha/beta hydrolase [Chloroflexota bacterium]|nr:alpha/beta hydrolase [Chloroflexota bacterium]
MEGVENRDGTWQTVRLRDGRRLCFGEFGDPAGVPLFFFHGGGDSRVQRHHDDTIAGSLGIRLITVDRPGVGRSDIQRRRRLVDWPDDVTQLAAALGIDRFAVLGYSLGGPFALACAWALRDRLLAVGVVSGVAPFDRPDALEAMDPFFARMFRLGRLSQWAVQVPLLLLLREMRRGPYALADRLYSTALECDRQVYSDPYRRENAVAAMVEGAGHWGQGLARDLAIVTRPWGFRLGEITTPVQLWYGTSDRTTPLQMARCFESSLPNARLTLWDGEGHQAIFTHWREILQSLVTAGAVSGSTGG